MNSTNIQASLAALNNELVGMGLLEIAVVKPSDCIQAPVNARYFLPETMRQLVENIKVSGHLESTPLVYRLSTQPGKYGIISGNHRVEGALTAGVQWIMVMVCEPGSEEVMLTKQLAHNALVGKDDPVILAELFGRIKDIQLKLQTGLSSEVAKISYPSLNFKLGATRQVVFLFVDEDSLSLDQGMATLEELARTVPVTSSDAVRIVDMGAFEHFAAIMRKVKKSENIKSNATAMLYLLKLAQMQLDSSHAKGETAHTKAEEGSTGP